MKAAFFDEVARDGPEGASGKLPRLCDRPFIKCLSERRAAAGWQNAKRKRLLAFCEALRFVRQRGKLEDLMKKNLFQTRARW
jgi:hypothetical protein